MDDKVTNYTGWQSDVIVDCIKRYGFPYITLNPGASFRGLHDSLVNYGDNQPPMMVCTHEEIAVQIAHGYAKATGKPLVVILHNLVGLLHACMAIYYAHLDRVPIFIVGATGPMAIFSAGSPTFTCWAVSRAIAIASSIREFGTSMRDGALQLCPELGIMFTTPARTLSAKPASSRTMLGLLPPSSWVTRFTVAAAFLATSTPARVDPVNETMSTSGWLASATPTPGPSPLTRL